MKMRDNFCTQNRQGTWCSEVGWLCNALSHCAGPPTFFLCMCLAKRKSRKIKHNTNLALHVFSHAWNFLRQVHATPSANKLQNKSAFPNLFTISTHDRDPKRQMSRSGIEPLCYPLHIPRTLILLKSPQLTKPRVLCLSLKAAAEMVKQSVTLYVQVLVQISQILTNRSMVNGLHYREFSAKTYHEWCHCWRCKNKEQLRSKTFSTCHETYLWVQNFFSVCHDRTSALSRYRYLTEWMVLDQWMFFFLSTQEQEHLLWKIVHFLSSPGHTHTHLEVNSTNEKRQTEHTQESWQWQIPQPTFLCSVWPGVRTEHAIKKIIIWISKHGFAPSGQNTNQHGRLSASRPRCLLRPPRPQNNNNNNNNNKEGDNSKMKLMQASRPVRFQPRGLKMSHWHFISEAIKQQWASTRRDRSVDTQLIQFILIQCGNQGERIQFLSRRYLVIIGKHMGQTEIAILAPAMQRKWQLICGWSEYSPVNPISWCNFARSKLLTKELEKQVSGMISEEF